MDDSDYLSDKLAGKSILYSRRTERYHVRVRADLVWSKIPIYMKSKDVAREYRVALTGA
jgi:hypothetical protein